ncbi:MAG: amidohydrolase, partial [Bacteroidota bacterium]
MRIDAHQHFWQFDPLRDTWIEDHMKVIRRDFIPSDLKPELDKNSVDGCIAVQADQSENETKFLLDLSAKNPWIK